MRDLDGRELAVGVAARFVVHPNRVALRVHQQRLFARQRDLHRTPRCQAARAVCAWFDMSSFPPNAPPFETSSVVIRCVESRASRRCRCGRPRCPGRRNTRTGSGRRGPSPRTGTASVDSGSRKACSMRWVWNVSVTVCGRRAAASTSPRAVRGRGQDVAVEFPHGRLIAVTHAHGVDHGLVHVVIDSPSSAAARAIWRVSARPRRARRRDTRCVRPRGS